MRTASELTVHAEASTPADSLIQEPRQASDPDSSEDSRCPLPRVLMVTGAYYPEMSGGGLQCRELVRALKQRLSVSVLTTSTDSARPAFELVDGVPVHRVHVDLQRSSSMFLAALRLILVMITHRRRFDIVHLHGFSTKSVLVSSLARTLKKRVVIKLTSVGHDDPQAMRARGGWFWRAYAQADLLIGVSPRFEQLAEVSGFPKEKCRTIPNGVDTNRFRPGDPVERAMLRTRLGLPGGMPLVLFVGFFSREKHPEVLFEAWWRIQQAGGPMAGLVFIGATRSRYAEINPHLADEIRSRVKHHGVEQRVFFIERTDQIEQHYRCADLFVLPSSREGLPNALLEAMATGLPSIASRLPGVTDALIEDGNNGLLVPPEDPESLALTMQRLLADAAFSRALGCKARATVEARYAIERIATRYQALYRELMKCAA